MTRTPLLPLTIFYCVGIVGNQWLGFSPSRWALVTLVVFAWVLWLFRTPKLAVCFVLMGFLCLGAVRVHQCTQGQPPAGHVWPGIPEGPQVYEGEVISYPQSLSKFFRYRVQLLAWKSSGFFTPITAVAQISQQGETAPQRGNIIRFRANLKTPRNFGNDREGNYERYCQTRGIDLLGTVANPAHWTVIRPTRGVLRRGLNLLRSQAMARAETYLSANSFQIFTSLVFGEPIRANPTLVNNFRSWGVLHLLVVSGFHVGWMAISVAWAVGLFVRQSCYLVERLGSSNVKMVGGLLGATGYCLLTELSISTQRALLVVFFLALAMGLKRSWNGLALWNCTILLLLLFQPLWLMDLSFQLSAVAVLGILLALEAFSISSVSPAKSNRVFSWVRNSLIVSTGAYVATLPVIVYHFGRTTIWSIPGNLFFVPTIGALGTTMGFLGTFLACPLGDYCFCVLDRVMEICLWAMSVIHFLPARDIWIPQPSVGSLMGFVLVVLLLYLSRTRNVVRSKPICVGYGIGCLAMVVPYAMYGVLVPKPLGEIHFLHVGNGDAIVLRSAGEETILVDAGRGGLGGSDAGQKIVIPWLRSHGINRLALLAVTHGDIDHAGGAESLLSEFPVEELWLPTDLSNPLIRRLRDEAVAKGIPYQSIISTSSGRIEENFVLTPLWPLDRNVSMNDNDSSLVFRVDMGGFRILLTGDIGHKAERYLQATGVDLISDVLKVAHHGSRFSTSEKWLVAVRPKVAILLLGWKNRYQHPAPEVLDRLEKHGILAFRGDECGEIVIRVYPGEMKVECARQVAKA